MNNDNEDTATEEAWIRRLRPLYPTQSWDGVAKAQVRHDLLTRLEQKDRAWIPRWPSVLGQRAAVFATALLLVIGIGAALTLTTSNQVSAAVDFTTVQRGEDSFVVASIVDPFRAAAEYNAAFAEQGLDITIDLLPASPSRVGRTTTISDNGTGIQPLATDCGNSDCPIGLEIPIDFNSSASITIGRPAEQDEIYITAAPAANVPGEVFEGFRLEGLSAAEMAALADEEGVVLEWKTTVDGEAVRLTADEVDPQASVLGATPLRLNTVLIWVGYDR